jgi:hypothetical protein
LGTECADKASVCDLAVRGYVGFGDEGDSVSAFDTVAHALGTSSKFIGGGVYPVFLGGGVGDQSPIFFADTSKGVDDGVGKRIADGMDGLIEEL